MVLKTFFIGVVVVFFPKLLALLFSICKSTVNVLEPVINNLQFSTTLLVLVIFFNNHDVLRQKLTKIGASDYHNESVKIVWSKSEEEIGRLVENCSHVDTVTKHNHKNIKGIRSLYLPWDKSYILFPELRKEEKRQKKAKKRELRDIMTNTMAVNVMKMKLVV